MGTNGQNWCFTLNNYTEDDVEKWTNVDCDYICFGREVGEEGTPHLQGVVRWKKNKRLSGCKKICERSHWEICRSLQNSIIYCKKDGDWMERGAKPDPGKRSDIDSAYEDMKNGMSWQEVAENHRNVLVKYPRGLQELYQQVRNKKRREKPTVIWCYGGTETGKTRWASEQGEYWISGKDLRWWLDYDNQEVAIIDDFRKDFCTFHYLLRILDRYPMAVEVKNGHRQLNSRMIIITCPWHPRQIYDNRSLEDIEQLMRRIDEVKEFT